MNNHSDSILSTPPANYEAFLYRWVNKSNGKKYVGIHKGSADDGYTHSSTDMNMLIEFNDPNIEWVRELLYFGSYEEMQTREHAILSGVNARNSDQYYNKSVGSPKYSVPYNEESCKQFVDDLNSGRYDQVEEEVDIHINMEVNQVRTNQYIPEHVSDIAERIKDTGLQYIDPPIIFEGRGNDGADQRINGTHTVHALKKARQPYVPVIRIPYDINVEFTDADIDYIGRLLNKRSQRVTVSNTESDAIDALLKLNRDNNIPCDATTNVAYLKSLGFSGTRGRGQVKKIIDKALKAARRQVLADAGKTLTTYNKRQLQDKVAELSVSDNECAIYFSSGRFAVDRLLETLANNPDANVCHIIIHHTELDLMHDWESVGHKKWSNILSTYVPNITFNFIHLDKFVDS